MNLTQNKLYPWVAWSLPALCFMLMYSARVAPASFLNELMTTFDVSHAALGVLGSAFLQGYVLMQIPVGLLADRFGAVRLIIISSVLCIFSNYLFECSETLAQAHMARLLLGVGSAFIFVCAFKQAKDWLPARYFAMACGLTQVLGMLGGALGSGWLHHPESSWRVTMHGITLAWCMLLALMVLLLRSPASKVAAQQQQNLDGMVRGLKQVFCNPVVWLNGMYAALVFLPTETLGGWWGSYYLSLIHHITSSQAGALIGAIFTGWAIGGAVIGYVAGRWNCTKNLMLLSALMSLVFLCLGIYARGCPLYLLTVIFFLYGVSNTGLVLAYAMASELVSAEAEGSSTAFTNVLSIMLGLVMQPLIGYFVSMLAHFGEKAAFDSIMLILPCSLLAAVYIALRLRVRLPKHI